MSLLLLFNQRKRLYRQLRALLGLVDGPRATISVLTGPVASVRLLKPDASLTIRDQPEGSLAKKGPTATITEV